MNSLIVNELKSINLFSETMINYIVSEYVDIYTVTLEFDTKDKHNSYKFTLDKFLRMVSKAPECLKQPVLYNGDCYCGTGIHNLKVSFYEKKTLEFVSFGQTIKISNKYLFSIDHLNLVPDALKSLQRISEDVKHEFSLSLSNLSINVENQEEVFHHENDNNEISLSYPYNMY